jgi:hypothetical protein
VRLACGSLRSVLLALTALASAACTTVCEDAASVAIDECGLEESAIDPECPERDECVAQCVVDHAEDYCKALRGDEAAVTTMNDCTSDCEN